MTISGHLYVIRNAVVMNVDAMGPDGICVKTWCFRPMGNLVRGDVLITQKLALE